MSKIIQVQSGTPETKKHLGAIITVVTIMVAMLSGALYLTLSGADETPPSLTPENSTIQGFIKSDKGNLGFIKVENSDLKTPQTGMDKLDIKFDLTKNAGLHYVYTDYNGANYENVLQSLSKEATIFMATWNPTVEKWVTTPHTYFKKDLTVEIEPANLSKQPIKAGQGFVFMTDENLTMNGVKDGSQFAKKDYKICENGEKGWNLFAAHIDSLNTIFSSCLNSVDSIWIQKSLDTVKQSDLFKQIDLNGIKDVKLSHALVWVKFKDKPVVNVESKISVSGNNPSAQQITKDQTNISFLAFDLTSTKDVTLKELEFTKIGTGSIGSFKKVQIFINDLEVKGDNVSFSTENGQTKIVLTLNQPLNKNSKIVIKGSMNASVATAGETHGFKLNNLKVAESGFAISGLPLVGNLMTVATPATPAVATVTLDKSYQTKVAVQAGQKTVEALKMQLTSSNNVKIKELFFHLDGNKQPENIKVEYLNKDGTTKLLGSPNAEQNGDFNVAFQLGNEISVTKNVPIALKVSVDIKSDSKNDDATIIELKSIIFVDESGKEIKQSYDLAGPTLITKNPVSPLITAAADSLFKNKEVNAGDQDVKIAEFNLSSNFETKVKELKFKLEGTGQDNVENLTIKIGGNTYMIAPDKLPQFKLTLQAGNELNLSPENTLKIEVFGDIKATSIEKTGHAVEFISMTTSDGTEFTFNDVYSAIVSITKQTPTQVTLTLDKSLPTVIEAFPGATNVEYAKLTISTDVPFKMKKLKFYVKNEADNKANEDTPVFKTIKLLDGANEYVSNGSEFTFGEGLEISGQKTFIIKVDIKPTLAEYQALKDTLYGVIIFAESPIEADKKINSIEDLAGPIMKLVLPPADLDGPPEE